MATRQEQLIVILDQLIDSLSSDISGVVAVSTDGIVLASRMSNEVNADRVGAVAATMIGVSRRVSAELKIGTPEETIIRADNGMFLVLPAGGQSLLAINLRPSANLGMVRLEGRDAAVALARVL